MTTGIRPGLNTPAIDQQVTAVGQTVRARDAKAVAELANDAATGRPGQTFWHGREDDPSARVINWFYYPDTGARELHLWSVCSWLAQGTTSPSMLMELTIIDSAGNSVGPVDDTIPPVYRGEFFACPNLRPNRLDSYHPYSDTLVIADLVAAGLVKANSPWRFQLEVNPADGMLECVGMEEVPRLDVDTADGVGVVFDSVNLRSPILATEWTQVLGSTTWAYGGRRQTYLAFSLAEAAPMTTSAVAWAELVTAGQESAGVPKKFRFLARDCRSGDDEAALWCFRYYLDGAPGDTADFRIVTGAGTYTVGGLATIGAWTDVLDEAVFVATGAVDEVYFEGQVSVGTATLKVCAVQVTSAPT